MMFALYMFCASLYVPETMWIRQLMRQHSQLLGDNWDIDDSIMESIDNNIKYPKYYLTPLHGFQYGGSCKYQALYQSPSMRYIMRIFQGDPFYREKTIKHVVNSYIIQQKSMNVIDLGGGTGDSTIAVFNALSDKVDNLNVYCVDLSAYMTYLAKLYLPSDITCIQANAARLDMFETSSTDLITVFAMFHEMPKRYSLCVLEECYRVLKIGGHLIIWDQKVTKESAATQSCKGVPSIEPYLKSYADLNIKKWMEGKGMKTENKDDKFMQFWVGKKI
tara:strand:- start:1241 stop:2068 length:828 start_codon:yes stop_codon:yes gene_type:complete